MNVDDDEDEDGLVALCSAMLSLSSGSWEGTDFSRPRTNERKPLCVHTGLNPPGGANLEACATSGDRTLECLKHRVVSKVRTQDADSSLGWRVSDLGVRVRVRVS